MAKKAPKKTTAKAKPAAPKQVEGELLDADPSGPAAFPTDEQRTNKGRPGDEYDSAAFSRLFQDHEPTQFPTEAPSNEQTGKEATTDGAGSDWSTREASTTPLATELDQTEIVGATQFPAENKTAGRQREQDAGNAGGIARTTASTTENDTGDVAIVDGVVDSFPGAELLSSSSRARLSGEKKHEYWERMRKAARLAGLPRGQGVGTAYCWATEQTDREFPPSAPIVEDPEPEVLPTVGTSSEPAVIPVAPAPIQDDQGVSGLSDLPASWPELPANAQLQVEIAWVTANRLRVRDGTGVNLSKALSPAPSYSALSWLETSILFPAKFADISVKATATQDDEREFIRREKMAIEEIRSILAEMLEAEG